MIIDKSYKQITSKHIRLLDYPTSPIPVTNELGKCMTPILNGSERPLNGIKHAADEGESKLQSLVHNLLHSTIFWKLLFFQLQELRR